MVEADKATPLLDPLHQPVEASNQDPPLVAGRDPTRGSEGLPRSYINLTKIFSEASGQSPPMTFIQSVAPEDEHFLQYKSLLDSNNIPYEIITDVFNTFQTKIEENFLEFASTYAFGSVFNNTV
ncbi:hypothetical protein HPB50_010724 [Hyalomma asiaticum]|uniref:Uncharacterized protein n=1 Tax=Hyalomma asiaticum TaxID=266040 RepID=A0ACB7S7U0_HYAAI|nr:hypothetical protein HPB50_010724 [Hyalomma asiaticum]